MTADCLYVRDDGPSATPEDLAAWLVPASRDRGLDRGAVDGQGHHGEQGHHSDQGHHGDQGYHGAHGPGPRAGWISIRPALARCLPPELVDLADLAGVRILVQGEAEVALEQGLHGVELRPRGRAAAAARQLLGPERILALDVRGGDVPPWLGDVPPWLGDAPPWLGDAPPWLGDVDLLLLESDRGITLPSRSGPVRLVYATVRLSPFPDRFRP